MYVAIFVFINLFCVYRTTIFDKRISTGLILPKFVAARIVPRTIDVTQPRFRKIDRITVAKLNRLSKLIRESTGKSVKMYTSETQPAYDCRSQVSTAPPPSDVTSLTNKELDRELNLARLKIRVMELEAEAARRNENLQDDVSLKAGSSRPVNFGVQRDENIKSASHDETEVRLKVHNYISSIPDDFDGVVLNENVVRSCKPSSSENVLEAAQLL